jgi:YidC/Oxa1 family membrane protein insertase
MFYQLIAKPLEWFYGFWPNYAGAIGLLTMLIMIVLLPLTLKGTRSMLAMQKLQPEMKKLQAKHRDDRQKLNEEMMKFYKENNINPVSGCMPLLLQTPVFFFLYRTLYQLLNRAPYGQDMGAAVARQARGGQAYEQFGYFHPSHLDAGSRLYRDLSQTRQMRSFGFDLAESAIKAVSKGPGHAFPFIVLVLIVTATSFIQQRQISARTPQAAQSNPQQALMMKIMPLFLSVISLTLPAGIVVYFVVSNVFRIGQQALITRTMYAGEDSAVATTGREVDDSSAAEKPKGFLAQLREAGLPDPGQTKREPSGSGSQKTMTKTKTSANTARGGNGGQTKAKPKPEGPSKVGGGATSAKGKGNGAGSAATKGAAPVLPAKTSGSSAAGSSSPSARPSRSAPSAPNRNKKKRK